MVSQKLTYHVRFSGGFHSDLCVWIDSEARVEDAVRDLIAKFVWMAFTDGLRCEVNVSFFVVLHFGWLQLV